MAILAGRPPPLRRDRLFEGTGMGGPVSNLGERVDAGASGNRHRHGNKAGGAPCPRTLAPSPPSTRSITASTSPPSRTSCWCCSSFSWSSPRSSRPTCRFWYRKRITPPSTPEANRRSSFRCGETGASSSTATRSSSPSSSRCCPRRWRTVPRRRSTSRRMKPWTTGGCSKSWTSVGTPAPTSAHHPRNEKLARNVPPKKKGTGTFLRFL
jgi:hypothetical protein